MNATLISKDPYTINNNFFAFCKLQTRATAAGYFLALILRQCPPQRILHRVTTAFSTTASSTSFLNSRYVISISLKSIRRNSIFNLFPQQHPPTKHSSQQQPPRKHPLQKNAPLKRSIYNSYDVC
jgi:hypothetical protein